MTIEQVRKARELLMAAGIEGPYVLRIHPSQAPLAEEAIEAGLIDRAHYYADSRVEP